MNHKKDIDYDIMAVAVGNLGELRALRREARALQLKMRQQELNTITHYKAAGFSNLEIRALLGIAKAS